MTHFSRIPLASGSSPRIAVPRVWRTREGNRTAHAAKADGRATKRAPARCDAAPAPRPAWARTRSSGSRRRPCASIMPMAESRRPPSRFRRASGAASSRHLPLPRRTRLPVAGPLAHVHRTAEAIAVLADPPAPSDMDLLDRIAHAVDPQARLVRAWELPGGVSAQVLGLEIARADGRRIKLVLRRHGAVDLAQNPHIAADEYRLLGLLSARGVPAPLPYTSTRRARSCPRSATTTASDGSSSQARRVAPGSCSLRCTTACAPMRRRMGMHRCARHRVRWYPVHY